MEERYIGPYKVLSITPIEMKTSLGSEVVEVLFEDGHKKIMPTKSFDLLVTNTASDLTSISDKKITQIMSKCLEVIEEYDVDLIQWEKVGQKIITALNENMNRARNFLWFKDDNRFTAGIDSENDVSLLMIKQVVGQIPKTNGKEENTTK